MPRSAKNRAKPPVSHAEFAKATGELERLQHEFPEAINQMTRLLIAANKDCQSRLHEFAFALGNIVYFHGRRLNSPSFKPPRGIEMTADYLGNQRLRRDKVIKATQLLNGLTNDIFQLDVSYLTKFAASYYNLPAAKITGFAELLRQVDAAISVIQRCQNAYLATFPVNPIKRGRRPLPYIEATQELIDLWQGFTSKRVPISKTHQGQTSTPAAEFIRLGLSLIDPDVLASNVVTAINRIRHSHAGMSNFAKASKQLGNKKLN